MDELKDDGSESSPIITPITTLRNHAHGYMQTYIFGRLNLERVRKKLLTLDNVTFCLSSEPLSPDDTFYMFKP